jgi:hypothetical protein
LSKEKLKYIYYFVFQEKNLGRRTVLSKTVFFRFQERLKLRFLLSWKRKTRKKLEGQSSALSFQFFSSKVGKSLALWANKPFLTEIDLMHLSQNLEFS